MLNLNITSVSKDLKEDLQNKINNKTKPLGSLGVLEDLAIQIGMIQNTLSPKLTQPTIMVFAGDHGIVKEGVSPFPQEVTYQMVYNFLNSGAAINVFTKQHAIDIKVIDAGVNHDFQNNDNLINAKVAYGTKNYLKEPAMTMEECEKALLSGFELVEEAHSDGSNVIGFGEMGIGNTSSAAILMSLLCDIPIEECVGAGTGLDPEGIKRKASILKSAIENHNLPKNSSAYEILATFGGFEIAMMCGAFLKAAEKKMVILADGFIATSALLVASKIDPKVLEYTIFSHLSDESGHKKMIKHLDGKPIVNLNMRLGEGTGAAICYPIVSSAVKFLNEMASFESASVSNKD